MGRYAFREAVNYPPWVGSAYGQKGTRRTLLIGRSYYDARYGNQTIPDYIKTLIKTGKEDLFFNAAEQIVSERQHWKQSLGKKLNLDRKKFWNSVVFHQFLQGILEESYTVPSRQMWKQAQDIFKRVLLSLEPEIVVIFSREVFDNIPTMGGANGPEFSYGSEVMRTWTARVNSSPVSLCRMMHPRKGTFRVEVWKNLYNQFIGDHKNRFGKVYF